MTFKEKLTADLKAERYTFRHLAEEAQISPSYLSRIMTGQLCPSIHLATSLAITVNRLTGLDTYTPDQFMTITRIHHS
jgi:transcriptional regulator with XRE-family HTH domain